jgi:hypothetical protein
VLRAIEAQSQELARAREIELPAGQKIRGKSKSGKKGEQ